MSSAKKSPDCPVCHSGQTTFLRRYTVKEAATYFCPEERNPDRHARMIKALNPLWPEGFCDIYQCKDCGFAFGYPHVGGSEEFYAILHEDAGYPAWRWDYDVAMGFLGERSAGRVLDIGAGYGNFLKGLSGKWEKIAVESSPLTVAELKRSGVAGYLSVDEVEQAYPDGIDCVTMFQSLEHISDFRTVLNAASRLLKPGGRLIITVPDGDAMLAQEAIIQCPDMPPNHINKWSEKSLQLAVKEVGLLPVATSPEKKSLKNLRSKLFLKMNVWATVPGSVSQRVFSIKNHRLKQVAGLVLLAPAALLALSPHLGFLFKGGAFCLVAEKPITQAD